MRQHKPDPSNIPVNFNRGAQLLMLRRLDLRRIDPSLSPHKSDLLKTFIVTIDDHIGKDGYEISVGYLAALRSRTPLTIRRWVKTLAALKVISVEKRFDRKTGLQTSNHFRINWSLIVDVTGDAATEPSESAHFSSAITGDSSAITGDSSAITGDTHKRIALKRNQRNAYARNANATNAQNAASGEEENPRKEKGPWRDVTREELKDPERLRIRFLEAVKKGFGGLTDTYADAVKFFALAQFVRLDNTAHSPGGLLTSLTRNREWGKSTPTHKEKARELLNALRGTRNAPTARPPEISTSPARQRQPATQDPPHPDLHPAPRNEPQAIAALLSRRTL